MYHSLRNKSEQGYMIIELIISIAILAMIFLGIYEILYSATNSWTTNSKRLNYVQAQQDTNTLFQVINDKIKFANSAPTVSSSTSILYTINDPASTTVSSITYKMYINNNMLVQDQISPVGTTNVSLFNIPFYNISFSTNDTQSIVVTAQKTSSVPSQQMIISCGGFK